mgnify:CR=1 FL=1
MLRCIFCGFCQEVCPEEAIFLQKDYSLTGTSRAEMIYNKEKLLAIAAKVRTPELRTILERYATYNGSDPRSAPATLDKYRCMDCPPGEPLAFLVFPKPARFAGSDATGPVETITLQSDGSIGVRVRHAAALQRPAHSGHVGVVAHESFVCSENRIDGTNLSGVAVQVVHRHREPLRGTAEEPALQVLLGRKGDRMNEDVEATPFPGDLLEHGLELAGLADVEGHE